MTTLQNVSSPQLQREAKPVTVEKLVVLFLLGFSLIYTLIPVLFYQSVLPDSAQNITWGHYLGWSYHRHPPLGTWLITLMNWLFNDNEVAAFSSSVLCLSVSLWFIYKLSRRYLAAKEALVACIFSSLTLYFLTNFVLQYNQNSIMLPFWVMVGYFADKCLRDNRWSDWLLLSVVSAASMLAKYESLLIIALAFCYLMAHFKREYLAKLVTAFVISLVLLLPHLASIAHHGLISITTIHEKFQGPPLHGFLYLHLVYPLKALVEQLGHFLPALLLLMLFVRSNGEISKDKSEVMPRFNYIVYLGLTPLVLVVFISMFLGLKIQPEWGFPLFSFTIPALMSYFNIKINASSLKHLVVLALIFHLVSLFGYKYTQFYISKQTRTSYPSYALAKKASSYWQQFSNQPIRYVGGDESIYYYLGAYLPDKPLGLEHYSVQESPWLSEEKIKKHGLLMVMDGCDIRKSKKLQAQFSAQAYTCIELPMSNKYNRRYKQLTLMVVPPAVS